MNRPPLMPHQQDAVDWVRRVGRGLLGDEPGLGKSRTAIQAFDGARTLIIAPAIVVKSGTWGDQLDKWADHPDQFTLATYSMLNGRVKTGANASATRPTDSPRPEYAGHWDALVVDEAHYTKGRKTTWTKAVEQIARNSDQVLEMTGTPIPNWGYELYTILRVLHPDQASPGEDYGSYWRWALRWFENQPTRFQPYHLGGLRGCGPQCEQVNRTGVCEHYQRFMQANLGDQFLRRTRGEVLGSLPPLTETRVETPMAGAQLTAYRELKRNWVTQLGGEELVAWTPGSRMDQLDLLTVSDWMLNPRGEPRGGKLDRLAFDLASRANPTVVFAYHRSVVEAAARVAGSVGARAGVVHGGRSGDENGDTVRRFLDGDLDVLCGSLSVMSEGLNLTRADMLVFVEKTHRTYTNEQAMRRVHRIGQGRPVTVLDYVTPRSVDDRKRTLLQDKEWHQGHMLDAVRVASLL